MSGRFGLDSNYLQHKNEIWREVQLIYGRRVEWVGEGEELFHKIQILVVHNDGGAAEDTRSEYLINTTLVPVAQGCIVCVKVAITDSLYKHYVVPGTHGQIYKRCRNSQSNKGTLI